MSRPNERQLRALLNIRANDQGATGDLDIFAARECEGLGWVTKVDGLYRLTEAGSSQLHEAVPEA